MKVYLDGQIVDDSDARLSVFDASIQHGVGLFETVRAYNGRPFRCDAHMERLVRSAEQLGLGEKLRPSPLCEAVELTLQKNGMSDARVRLTLTGGNLSLLGAAQNKKQPRLQPSIFISATEPTVYPESFFTDGVSVVIADPKANPFDPLGGHKTVNYWSRLNALAAAAQGGAGEALWFTVTNHLCGGCVSNAFIVKSGQLHTPIARGQEPQGAIPSPVLPGVIRAAVIEVGGKLNIPVVQRMLTINDVLEADELFLTNSSWLVLPVAKVEKESIAGGKTGEVTKQIYEELLKLIASECGAATAGAVSE